MTINNKYSSLRPLLLAAFCAGCGSVATLAQEGLYRYQDATQLWRLTDNAAGLGVDASASRGYAAFGLQHRSGDYRRVQEGGQRNQLRFDTERYQRIGRLLTGYGHFRFDMDRTKDRAWADVWEPYHGNPLYSGSSVHASYDTQLFDLTAALSTIPIPLAGGDADRELTAGMRADYKVGDLSRLRDPRSRSELLDYRLTPSVTYTFGRHTLGLSGHYRRRKEKIPNMLTVQDDPSLKYYLMQGMEFAYGNVGDYKGFSRQWVRHQFGASLAYGSESGGTKSLTTLSALRGSEDVNGTEKQSAGHHQTYRFALGSHWRLSRPGRLHQIDIDASYEQAYTDSYLQQRVQTNDEVTGVASYHYETLVNYRKGYQVNLAEAGISYRANMTSDNAVTAYVGIAGRTCHTRDKHLLPDSRLTTAHTTLTLQGGKALFARRLWVDGSCGRLFSHTGSGGLQLADASTDFAQEVLLPDMDYYRASCWDVSLSLKYIFPLTLKGYKARACVKAYGDCVCAGSLHRQTVGLAFGIYN